MMVLAFWVAWLAFGAGYTSHAARALTAMEIEFSWVFAPFFVVGVFAGPLNLGFFMKQDEEGNLNFYFFGVKIR